jgi:hypothetical protein
LNTAVTERDAAQQERARRSAAAAEAERVVADAAVHRAFQARWDRVMKKQPFPFKHVILLVFRESPNTWFPTQLWAMNRYLCLQGRAMTFDFQHRLGTPELTTIRRKKTVDRRGLQPELMSSSRDEIVKLLDLYLPICPARI